MSTKEAATLPGVSVGAATAPLPSSPSLPSSEPRSVTTLPGALRDVPMVRAEAQPSSVPLTAQPRSEHKAATVTLPGAFRGDPGAPAPRARPEPRTVCIIGVDNGAGLSRDRDVLANAFRDAGWGVSFAGRTADSLPLVAVGLHLEVPSLQLVAMVSTAGRNVFVPNPEWWPAEWNAMLGSQIHVWAKTTDAARIFRESGASVDHVGFISHDRLDAFVERDRSRAFLHVAGASPNKGTRVLFDTWHADWPRLTIVTADYGHLAWSYASNITVLGRVSDEELRALQNRHRFHIYPSRYEGFGHAQWEGLSCGAITFVTDGPPFDEKWPGAWRMHARDGRSEWSRLVRWRDVTADGVAEVVERAARMSDAEVERASAEARAMWCASRDAFHGAARSAIERLI